MIVDEQNLAPRSLEINPVVTKIGKKQAREWPQSCTTEALMDVNVLL